MSNGCETLFLSAFGRARFLTLALPKMAPCEVLSGSLGFAVQALLFATVVALLVYKKTLDQRSWRVFFWDASKQLVGSGWLHVLNLAAATLLDYNGAFAGEDDECDRYWLNIMVDTTLGVLAEYVLLFCCLSLLRRCCGCELASGGYYDERTGELQAKPYLAQLALWLVVVTVMKAMMLGVLMGYGAACTFVAVRALSFLRGRPPGLKLVVVMVITPLVMNTVQLCLVDAFLRSPDDAAAAAAAAPPRRCHFSRAPVNDDAANRSPLQRASKVSVPHEHLLGDPRKWVKSDRAAEEGRLLDEEAQRGRKASSEG